MQIEEMRLDGNAAGGMLRELFVQDMTAAMATCAGCRGVGPVGALLDYGNGMGVILRCPHCAAAMLRVTRIGGALRMDPSGIALLVVSDEGSTRVSATTVSA